MANPFGSFLGALGFGEAPEQAPILSTADLINQANGTFQSTLPSYLAGQQALATGQTNIGLGVANQVDPSILSNFTGANKSILDQLNLGTSLDPALQAEITAGLLSTNAASGFGASAGGVGNVLYQTAIDKQNILRQRQQDALNAGSQGIGIANSFYHPTNPIGIDAIASDIRGVNAATQNAANAAENYKRNAFSNLIKTGLTIAGAVGGGLASGGALTGMGASIGSNIGNAFISTPQTTYNPNQFSWLNGLGTGNTPVTNPSEPFSGSFEDSLKLG